jgi:hypothetical protein
MELFYMVVAANSGSSCSELQTKWLAYKKNGVVFARFPLTIWQKKKKRLLALKRPCQKIANQQRGEPEQLRQRAIFF